MYEELDAPKTWSAQERCIGKFVILQNFFVFGKVDVLRKSLCLDLKMWRIALMDCVVSFLNEDCVAWFPNLNQTQTL